MARALVVGLGGLGCPAAAYLAAADDVELTLCDLDRVEEANLCRQPLYTHADVGRPKADAARDRLMDRASSLHVTTRSEPFSPEVVSGNDVVLDSTDDAATRALVHQACLDAGVPLAWAAVSGAEGQTAVVLPGRGPCLRCLWPLPGQAPGCDDRAAATVMGVMGALQAHAAMRILRGDPPATGVLTLFDGLDGSFRMVRFARRPGCVACRGPF